MRIVLLAIFSSCSQYTLINQVIHCMIITYINKEQCQDASHGRQIYNVESVTLVVQTAIIMSPIIVGVGNGLSIAVV